MDTLTNQGFTLFNFQEGYPNLINANQLIPPLRYLTTKEEFASLVSSSDSKLAVDQYWLSKASSKERARNLIRIYYSRVEFANKIFEKAIELNLLNTSPRLLKTKTKDYKTVAHRPLNSILDCTETRFDLGINQPFWENDLDEYLINFLSKR